jgi:phenylacetate-CoA ligase
MTSLAEERAEQERWTARLRRPIPQYDRLVEYEFDPPQVQHARVSHALGQMLGFAHEYVPFYRETLGGRGCDPFETLAAMPLLTKLDVHDAGPALQARALLGNDKPSNWTASSGTTGRPTHVLHSMISTKMFSLLKQREYRWFRFDPAGTSAAIRMPNLLPRRADEGELAPGETVRLESWTYMRNFHTGPFIGLSTVTPMDDRIAWLRRERPQYLMALAESLEHLAMAAGGERPAESLIGLLAISEQLTPGMRAFIGARFGAPVEQNYGLNEIGMVATRCAAGRYHVHTEHCLVEIVNDDGRECAPGQTGRIVVTGLTNSAMPLIRYDTGDLAESVSGDCACGRTLPTFGEIVGRYGRIAFLPPGTALQVGGLRGAIEKAPVELARDLREFQIHQFRDKRLELRLMARAPLPQAFHEHIRGEWTKSAGADGPTLGIVMVEEIPKSPGGKTEVFTSDFMPGRDDEGA